MSKVFYWVLYVTLRMSDDEDVRELSSKFDEEMLRTIEKESEQTKRQATFCAHETVVMPYRRRDNIDELHITIKFDPLPTVVFRAVLREDKCVTEP